MKLFKKGDVVLFRKTDRFISKVIAKVTSSSYTHVGIIKERKDKEDTYLIAEALSEGFVVNEYTFTEIWTRYKSRNIEILRPKSTLYETEVEIEKLEGTPYGFLQLLNLYLFHITNGLGLNTWFYNNQTRKLICSEAVARVLYHSSKHKLDLKGEYGKPFEFITPDDIFMSSQFIRA